MRPVELLPAIAIAVVVALLTLVLCDLAGGIARAKGRSYWLFFAFGLLLWFPAILVALRLPDRNGTPPVQDAGGGEKAVATVLLVLATLAGAAGVAAAVAFAP